MTLPFPYPSYNYFMYTLCCSRGMGGMNWKKKKCCDLYSSYFSLIVHLCVQFCILVPLMSKFGMYFYKTMKLPLFPKLKMPTHSKFIL